jgi:FixJ family two-component response regulator
MLETLFEERSMSLKAVLVIDDDKRTRENLRLLIELEGFVVDCSERALCA